MARPRRRDWPGDLPGQSFQGQLEGLPGAIYLRVSSNPDKTETKSTDDQKAEGLDWRDRTGVSLTDADIYTDDDFSASRYAVEDRPAFIELRKAVNAGKYKVVWFWATSRQTRGDIPLSELAAEYEEQGVLWCFSGSLYNPANDDDSMILEIHHIIDKRYSAQISRDVRRGVKASAYAGKPHGRIVYGYKRIHHPTELTKHGRPKVVRDDPNVYDGVGRPAENSPAYIVREIYDWIEAEKPVSGIARSLEDREIRTPQPPRKCRGCGSKTDRGQCPQGHGDRETGWYQWTAHAVLYIARNPFYAGMRVYQAASWRPADRLKAVIELKEEQEIAWKPLVTTEQWWRVQRVLGNPERLKFRPGHGRTLLAGVARCGECGNALHLHNDHSRGIVPYYVCSHRSHVGIRVDWLDEYVEDRIVSWLADKQVHAYLWGKRDDDTSAAAAARADVERLSHQIEECRVNGEDPEADAVFWERRSRSLKRKLAEAEQLARPASLSPVLAGMVGPDAADKWWTLRTDNLPAAKQLIKAVADIRVHKGLHGGDRRHAAIDPGRISWAWRTGPGDGERVFGETNPRPRDRAVELLRESPEETDRALARKVGVMPRTVNLARRDLEDAGEIPVIRRKGRSAPVNEGYQPQPPM
jgi:site-specific DNA recombinase